MSPGETFFLVLVVATTVVFAATLAGVSWMERSWARKNGK